MRLLSERFWSKVDKQGSTECWPWTASVVKNLGYGQFGMGGTMMRSHRVAWELSNGPIPAGMFVLHKCDNPPCCNPQHLFIGTQTDNMQDALAKGRHGHGTIGGPRKYSDALIKKALAEYESDDYMNDAANHAIYDVNTIANYDRDIVPFLNAPIGSAYERPQGDVFIKVDDFSLPDETLH